MLLKAPDRSLRSLRKRPAHRLKPQPRPSSRPAARKISQQRSKRSPRWQKPFSVPMASSRQRHSKTAVLSTAAYPLVAGEEDLASENLLIFQLGGESFGLRLASVAEIIRLPHLAHMPLV